ncbi:ABC transporter permease [Nonlabens sp. MIC269]|uniref:gliding motility-associated ABC transporter permease subunit GldF n=1 Tax=Nonlabens TaxID=363408 RepID=UPI00071F32C1|nr:gliding motility-associated ABC transporter permease subunit GldF [Nonlabens sp. MIC269]ALM20228.1 ABC transporter permease [Nonlabens sp. MIC269]
MRAIFIKEWNGYFSSITGYLIIGLFLLILGLVLFVFRGEFNLLDYGFADASPFFSLLPWLFLFLIPAITMRSFTTELQLGTMEMLYTSPLSMRAIIGGKFMASFLMILVALVPTILYILSLGWLGNPQFNIDLGSVLGSYLGALLLAASYVSIGLFASSLTSNQIIAFLLAAVLSFVMYFGFEGLASQLSSNDLVESLGMKYHYSSLSRGVLDTRDVTYFIVICVFFFALSENILTLKRKRK